MASLADLLAYSQNLAKKYTSLDTPKDMTLGETAGDIAMGFVPGLGTAQGARDFERARREKDMLGMGLSAASMLPVVGGVVKPIKKVAESSKLAKALEQVASKGPNPQEIEVYRGTQFANVKPAKNEFWSTNPLVAETYTKRKGNAQYYLPSENAYFDTYEEARKARDTEFGGKIQKLTHDPKIEKTTLKLQNPLIVEGSGVENWNWIKNPFVNPETLKKYEFELNSIQKGKNAGITNGRPWTKQDLINDLNRHYYNQVWTSTEGLAEQARKKGHDSVIIKNIYDVGSDVPNQNKTSQYLGDTIINLK